MAAFFAFSLTLHAQQPQPVRLSMIVTDKENKGDGFHKVDVQFVSTDGEKRALIVPPGYFVGPRTPKKEEKKP